MIVILFFQDVRFIFYNFLGDGIYDRLDNDKILHKIWSYKKAGQKFDNIHELCAKITDAIIKYSMEKNSVDNVTVIFVAFENFQKKMQDINFEYKNNAHCVDYPEQYDLSNMQLGNMKKINNNFLVKIQNYNI